ncbi:MAG: cation diffusion facilitator family transporter [Candidatus Erginobacter occultus]|nr:cation diffusion facilitator family transporter [Candidatus Erginobacter occultus]
MSEAHDHGTLKYNRAFAIGVGLNLLFVVVEIIYGLAADSLALLADAGHNFSDVVSLLLAWGAALLAARGATERRTYGFRKATVLASLAGAVFLLAALGGIAWESVGRLTDPEPVRGITVIIVAGIGTIINTITALLFFSGQKEDLNIRAAFLHMAADAGVSLGVAAAGVIILLTGWLIVDPIISLLIVAVIVIGTWSLLRSSINLALDAVPEGIDPAAIREYLTGLENVAEIHDLHVWPLSTTDTALTVHLRIHKPGGKNFLARVEKELRERFRIDHSTIQVEDEDEETCRLDRDGGA